MFKSAVEMLIKSLDDDGLNSFENFVTDFLGMGNISIKKFLEKKKKYETKVRKKAFDIKFYHKSKKTKKSQVVMKTLEDCNKIQYISKRRKRTSYKKN